MPAYASVTDVENLLPSSLPAAITTAHKNQWIADASAMVDGMVGHRFPMLSTSQKFADSPSAPAWIELATRWLAGYFGFLRLREINKSDKTPSQATNYYKLANDSLEKIRDGKIDIYDAAGADLASAETIWSSSEELDPVFSRGEYIDGTLQGDEGTLDDFEIA